MKVKRYESSTLQQALLEVKKDLGPEAVILQTRKFVKGSILGLFGREMVEVLAATDVNTTSDIPKPPRRVTMVESRENSSNNSSVISTANGQIDSLKKDIDEMKTILQKLVIPTELAKESCAPIQPSEPFSKGFGEVYLRLIENSVDPVVAQSILKFLDETLLEENKIDCKKIMEHLKIFLRELYKTSGVLDSNSIGTKIIAMVGPTGVGKTTTIAKLATILSLSKKKQLGLITADTYRIAAPEQIKIYAEILNIPIRVVYNMEDMKTAIESFNGLDYILIDTAGRSHKDKYKIQELRDVLSVYSPLNIHLVLSANMCYRNMCDVVEKFQPLSFNYLLFTKLDETSVYGNILGLVFKQKVGVSYLTFGQSVPEDIEIASPEKLIKLTLGEIKYPLNDK